MILQCAEAKSPAPACGGPGSEQGQWPVSVVRSLADQAGDLADGKDMPTDIAYDAGEGGEPDGPEEGFDRCEQHWLSFM